MVLETFVQLRINITTKSNMSRAYLRQKYFLADQKPKPKLVNLKDFKILSKLQS